MICATCLAMESKLCLGKLYKKSVSLNFYQQKQLFVSWYAMCKAVRSIRGR